MGKRIAIITGASSGMGRDFVTQIDAAYTLDEIWVIARRRERLENLQKEVQTPLRILAMDLTQKESIAVLNQILEREKPTVRFLVNASGFGRFGRFEEIPLQDSLDMIDLNCKAMVAVTSMVLPYICEGGNIIQMGSLSSFQPVPNMIIYAASKAFVLSYTRGLNNELRHRNICATAVCPGWVKTEFFEHAWAINKKAVNYYNIVYSSNAVVRTALKDAKKRKDVSIHGFPIKAQVLLVKLFPHKLVMWIWNKQQKIR